VQAPPSFTDLLADATAATEAARQDPARPEDDGVLSLAVPLRAIAGLDPLQLLPELATPDGFRFLWDGAPGLCLAAAGRCNALELSGARRFELAQRFSSASLGRLATPPSLGLPPLARPRVLLAFAFFDSPLQQGSGPAGVQAVLPRWQLARQGRQAWLRLQRTLGGGITARSVAEELWEKARRLETIASLPDPGSGEAAVGIWHSSSWHGGYRAAVERAI
jgi:menaquinone-specific isochorismate synthase